MTRNAAGKPGCGPRSGRFPGGFTLVELAIVLTIIGILMTVAVVTYQHFANKARFTQAQTALKHLQKTELIYFTEHDRYIDNVSLLDFDPVDYNYYVVSVTLLDNATNFVGHATGVGVMAGDLWHIDQEGDPYQDNIAKTKF